MKKLIYSAILISGCSAAYGQTVIGTTRPNGTGTASVLLDFARNENRGIILPYITALPAASAANEGGIALDASDAANAKVKFSNGTAWTDLSGAASAADVSAALAVQTSATENTAKKTVIGGTSSTQDGVVVLESATKALVLPQVASVADIVNPAPGMMVYVSAKNMMAVYNGAQWSFWK